MEKYVLSGYLIWFILSVVAQFHIEKNIIINRIRILDQFKLIPIWTFFAPNPCETDNVIIYKNFDENQNEVSGWKEVELYNKNIYFSFIWNPTKRLDKILSDSVVEIKEITLLVNKGKYIEPDYLDSIIKTSCGYLYILNFVASIRNIDSKVKFRQFAILETKGLDENKEIYPFYLSSLHKIR